LAALVAAFAFAITPIVVLLSRYNNPDPLMIFLMVAAVDAVLRGWESQRLRWFACTGAFLGLAFLTKQFQAFLVAPAISLVILAGLRSDWRNVLRAASVSAGGFLIFSATWLAVVDLTPAAQRPYVGGSQTNSLIELTLGYNGLNRVMDQANFSTAYIPQRFTSGNDVGLLRLFNANFGQESSWLLLLGLTSAPMIVWVFRRTSLAWHAVASSTWLVTTYLVLSFMGQDIHTYYTISLAPPLALTIGLTIEALRLRTMSVSRRVIISGGICLSTLSSWLTLNSLAAPEAQLLGLSALSLGLAGAALLAVPPPRAWINRVASTLAIVGLSVGPLATDLSTLSHAQTGSNPLSGSLTSSPTSMSRFLEEVRNNDPEWAHDTAFGAHPPTPAVELLLGSPPTCRWAAATLPAQTAANWQLASDKAIMPVGGFAATDPYPSFEEFKSLVLSGSICYYIDYPEMDPIATHQQTVTAILSWVRNTYAKETVEGVTIYKLAPKP
jgi:4-amino-4-deoxy-L-arabinose transferase-like glycosyltransferase